MKECPACKRCFPDDINHCPNDGDETVPSIAGEPILDGRYQLERRLGQGGMGVVFQARHIFLKTAHAIKIILPDLVGNDPMLITRFRQEALAAAAIKHQNIIAVTDFGVVRATMPFLVMEFVNGPSLHDILAEEKILSPERALEIIGPVCAGVGAAHRQNIVHRDLKPLNIMIQEDVPVHEGVKILDFGLAKIKSGELLGSFVQAKTSGLMGSPFYMAPEQWSDEEPDVRADIYSLGVILYQMLGGDVPFKGTSIPSIMKKHLTLDPPPLKSLGVEVDPLIESVIRHALEKEADHRPSSADEFQRELRRAVAGSSHTNITVASQRIPAGALEEDASLAPTSFFPSNALAGETVVGTTALRVHSVPPQSRVFINRVFVGQTDEAGNLAVPEMPRGAHHVRVLREGFAEWEREIECGGDVCNVEAQLHNLTGGLRFQVTSDQLAGTISSSAHTGELAEQQSQASMQAQALRNAAAANAVRATDDAPQQEVSGAQAREESAGETAGAPARGASVSPTAHTAATTSAVQQLASGFDATQKQRQGTVTQSLGGDVSLPGAAQDAAREFSSPTQAVKKSSVPLMLAAVLALVVIGGGLGAYLMWAGKTSAPRVDNAAQRVNTSPSIPAKTENLSTRTLNKPDMIQIPGGTFQMGRNDGTVDEAPAHSVTISPFSIDKTEVTNAEYADFVRETKRTPPGDWTGNKFPEGQDQVPVTNVSLEDAEAFAAWRSQRDNVKYRLPTEEEWEYAARGGDQENLYPWGNRWIENRAVTKDTNDVTPRAVGSFPDGKTRWGALDMLGNVWEWTATKVARYPENAETQIKPAQKDWIIIRGGSYGSQTSGGAGITLTFRQWVEASRKHPTLGFRLVRVDS